MASKEFKRLIIIDISSWIFRAFYAIRPLTAPDGTPVNAVHGVMSMILKLLSKYQPTHIFVARDGKGGSFRNELYDEYKANRSEPPEDLIPQFDLIAELQEKMNLPNLVLDNYEADDIIGSAAVQWAKDFDEVLIATGDKDLMQFVSEKVKILDTMKEKIYDPEGVFEKMGVHPHQIVDYLSMLGDASDNIPGMKGVGAKGAAKLLAEHGSLENCIKVKDSFKGKKLINAFENHLEDALLSKKLIQIVTDLDLKETPEGLKYSFYPTDELYQFLENLGMNSTIKKMKDLAQAHSEMMGSENEGEVNFGIINTQLNEEYFEHLIVQDKKGVKDLLREIAETPNLGFYMAFDSDDIYGSNIISFGLSTDGKKTFFVPVSHKYDEDLVSKEESNLSESLVDEILDAILLREDLEVSCLNAKRIYSHFFVRDKQVKSRLFDVTQAHFVMDPGARHDIISISNQLLNLELKPLDKKGPSYQVLPLSEAAKFTCSRAGVLFLSTDSLKGRLVKENLESVYNQIDSPLNRVLAKMERRGVLLNSGFLRELQDEFEKELQVIKDDVISEVGEDFNLKSPKQVGEILFTKLELPVIKKTKTGYSTDSEVLTELDSRDLSPVPGLILKFRELEKLLSTYIKALPQLVNPMTERLHTNFNQNVAATGRLSSDKPNLQNIPVRTKNGRLIRKGFIASPGKILLSADYSQVELRILAHFSEDPTMVKSFQEGVDIHSQTASEVLGVQLKDVSSEERSKAKAVNFGLMYGQSSFGLSKALRISRKEAKDYITLYFQRFSKVKAYLDSLKEECERTGYSITMFNRKRFLPDIKSTNRTIKSMAERVAINSPIQGTAADIIKIAMLNIDKEMMEKELKSEMVLQVHDELIFEVPEDELSTMKELVKRNMEGAAKLKVPLTVDMGVGVNWFDLK